MRRARAVEGLRYLAVWTRHASGGGLTYPERAVMRDEIERLFAASGGKHLVVVRYATRSYCDIIPIVRLGYSRPTKSRRGSGHTHIYLRRDEQGLYVVDMPSGLVRTRSRRIRRDVAGVDRSL